MVMLASCPERLPAGKFFGVNHRSVRLSGVILSDTHYTPALGVPAHEHALAYFCLLLGGGYREEYGRRRRVTYDSLSVAFHPPEDEHQGNIGALGGRCFHAELEPSWVERARERGWLPAERVDWHAGGLVWLASRLYREFASVERGSGLVIEGLVLEMLGAVLRQEPDVDRRRPRWLELAVERLHDELAKPLTVAALARDLDVSPIRLSRAFRKHYRQSVGEYLRRLRVEQAAKKLVDPAASLAEVALACGFSDQSHFNRVFRRLTGWTPGQFQKALSESANSRSGT